MTASASEQRASWFPLEGLLLKPVSEDALMGSLRRILPSVGQRSIFVVDEDRSVLRTVVPMLERMGLHAVAFGSAEEALRVAEVDLPGLVVLDLLMPGLDGFEFIAHFHKLRDAHAVPIVVWTAKDLSVEEEARLRQSASAAVAKGSASARTLFEHLRPLEHRTD